MEGKYQTNKQKGSEISGYKILGDFGWIDNNLDNDIALYPYELVTYGETGSVFQNWMQYHLVKKYLQELINNKIEDYGDARDFPGVNGTSKLSPFLKFGQIHVETIWKKCQDIKVKKIGYRKYINELGWREFSHSLINYFPQMLKGNLRKDFDNFPWVKNDKFLKETMGII